MCLRLSVADNQLIRTRLNQAIARLVHKTQVARLQNQLDMLSCPFSYVYALEASQRTERIAGCLRRDEICFDDLIAVAINLTTAGPLAKGFPPGPRLCYRISFRLKQLAE
ncbi:hypothetical protein HNQ77_002611 [Silvibacterium bohemicum]|uniref:Uncharacterized protein n=1 Tax=Silvibacterium bohemicum TaxID=1577686 RepID=A0A841JVT6_9BACT|nr:hypothetical protein [Silvibacterium bohemicum]